MDKPRLMVMKIKDSGYVIMKLVEGSLPAYLSYEECNAIIAEQQKLLTIKNRIERLFSDTQINTVTAKEVLENLNKI